MEGLLRDEDGAYPQGTWLRNKGWSRHTPFTGPLGRAIQVWLSASEGEPLATSHTPDLFDATIRMTFSLGTDTEVHSAHAAALRGLLETRNELIHDRFVKFQWDSPEECDRLVMQLDELNQSIARQIEYVHSILDAFRSTCQEHIEMLQAAADEEWPPGERSEGNSLP